MKRMFDFLSADGKMSFLAFGGRDTHLKGV